MSESTGTITLQKSLLNCLIGNYNINNMPMYLGTYDDDDNIISNDIVFTAKHIEGNDTEGYKVVFTATLLSNNIPKSGDDVILKMLNSNKQPLASITKSISEFSDLEKYRQIVFTWEITLPLASTT